MHLSVIFSRFFVVGERGDRPIASRIPIGLHTDNVSIVFFADRLPVHGIITGLPTFGQVITNWMSFIVDVFVRDPVNIGARGNFDITRSNEVRPARLRKRASP